MGRIIAKMLPGSIKLEVALPFYTPPHLFTRPTWKTLKIPSQHIALMQLGMKGL